MFKSANGQMACKSHLKCLCVDNCVAGQEGAEEAPAGGDQGQSPGVQMAASTQEVTTCGALKHLQTGDSGTSGVAAAVNHHDLDKEWRG